MATRVGGEYLISISGASALGSTQKSQLSETRSRMKSHYDKDRQISRCKCTKEAISLYHSKGQMSVVTRSVDNQRAEGLLEIQALGAAVNRLASSNRYNPGFSVTLCCKYVKFALKCSSQAGMLKCRWVIYSGSKAALNPNNVQSDAISMARR